MPGKATAYGERVPLLWFLPPLVVCAGVAVSLRILTEVDEQAAATRSELTAIEEIHAAAAAAVAAAEAARSDLADLRQR